jgi:hypothetical protein
MGRSLAQPASALPIILFDNPVTITLDGETVQLIPLPPSHTNGDTAVKFVKRSADDRRCVPLRRISNSCRSQRWNHHGLLQSIEKFLEITEANSKCRAWPRSR